MSSDPLIVQSQFFPLSGNTLTLEERTKLQASILLLQAEHKFHHVSYWGRINTVAGSYHIVQGHSKEVINGEVRGFYSSNKGLTWSPLFEPNPNDFKYLDQLRGPFMGDPTYAYQILEDIPKEELERDELPAAAQPDPQEGAEETAEKQDGDAEDEPSAEENGEPQPEKEEEEEAEAEQESEEKGDDEDNPDGEDGEENPEESAPKKPKPTQRIVAIKEEVRLSYVVRSIDNDTSVVPRGSMLLTATQDVTPSPSFEGISHEKCLDLANYVHFRTPRHIKLESLLHGERLLKSLDFLDPLDKDIPAGCWSLQYDGLSNTVIGRSLLWPGYMFYHLPKTRIFGSFYFGSGEKNLDICFML